MSVRVCGVWGMGLSFDERERLVRESLVQRVDYHVELGSTNDRALELLAQNAVTGPTLVLAEHQRAGRGRGQNVWWSARGALTFTLIVQPHDFGLSTRDLPQMSLSTGLAICEAIGQHAPTMSLGLKWPNDVHCNGRKLAGVLVEIPPQPPQVAMPGEAPNPWLVIGVGVNVGNTFRAAPDSLRSTATSLIDETGQDWELAPILLTTLQQLTDEFHALARASQDVLARWQERCVLQGHTISVTAAGQVVTGTCRGIDETGGLLIDTMAGTQHVIAGHAVRID